MLLLGFLLALIAVMVLALERSYQYLPLRELKRQARGGDTLAQLLYRPAAYGISLKVLLGGMGLVFGGLALACVINALGVLLGIVALGAFVGAFLIIALPRLPKVSLWLAKHIAPALGWLLERLQPILDGAVRFVRRHRPVSIHTGLYEKDDLVELLARQKGQPDSRISVGEVDLILHTLSFGEKLVADTLVPKRVVKLVAATDSIGPVLMDELNKSGHSRFPVYDIKRDNIVGILYLRDLVGARSTGTVAQVMSHKLTYVHEDFTLYQTLQVFLKTKQHLFLVVNSFEELVGIITIEDILEQMIGKSIVDEFDRYDDMRAVAAAAAKQDHKSHTEVKATTEPPEVVK